MSKSITERLNIQRNLKSFVLRSSTNSFLGRVKEIYLENYTCKCELITENLTLSHVQMRADAKTPTDFEDERVKGKITIPVINSVVLISKIGHTNIYYISEFSDVDRVLFVGTNSKLDVSNDKLSVFIGDENAKEGTTLNVNKEGLQVNGKKEVAINGGNSQSSLRMTNNGLKINGDEYGGLVNAIELKQQLDTTNNYLETLIAAVENGLEGIGKSTAADGSLGKLQFQISMIGAEYGKYKDIENKTILHGAEAEELVEEDENESGENGGQEGNSEGDGQEGGGEDGGEDGEDNVLPNECKAIGIFLDKIECSNYILSSFDETGTYAFLEMPEGDDAYQWVDGRQSAGIVFCLPNEDKDKLTSIAFALKCDENDENKIGIIATEESIHKRADGVSVGEDLLEELATNTYTATKKNVDDFLTYIEDGEFCYVQPNNNI